MGGQVINIRETYFLKELIDLAAPDLKDGLEEHILNARITIKRTQDVNNVRREDIKQIIDDVNKIIDDFN